MGHPFLVLALALALGLRFESWKFTSCLTPQQAAGQLLFLLDFPKGMGRWLPGSCPAHRLPL